MPTTRRRLTRVAVRLAARHEDPFAHRREAEEQAWVEERIEFLRRVSADLRAVVAAALADPDRAGDLGGWVLWPVASGASMPAAFPAALVRAMLDDPDACPLHECERCGARVPVRAGCERPFKPAVTLFPTCPACGGRTGYDAYWHVRRET